MTFRARGERRDELGGVSLSRLVPFLPTTERRFTAADMVETWVAVYQGLGHKLAPVSVAEIRDAADRTELTETTAIRPEQFRSHVAEYRFAIPLARLRPADYLPTTRAVLEQRTGERTVRFTVK